jgi:hypothetical protein
VFDQPSRVISRVAIFASAGAYAIPINAMLAKVVFGETLLSIPLVKKITNTSVMVIP